MAPVQVQLSLEEDDIGGILNQNSRYDWSQGPRENLVSTQGMGVGFWFVENELEYLIRFFGLG